MVSGSGFPLSRERRIHPYGNLHHVIPTNLHPVIPTRTENQNQKPKIPSFPQKRESSPFSFGHFR
ncbi:hypothetical protein FOG07_08415 [Neisseria meningitidis]|nr:hypothetical protein [Neisseria meningitidis]